MFDTPPIEIHHYEENHNLCFKEEGSLGEPFFLALDQLSLPVIQPNLGIYPFPTLGYYCDTYPTFELLMLLKRDGKKASLIQSFPSQLQSEITKIAPEVIEFYFIVASTENVLKAINNATPIVNLLCHAWKYPSIELGQTFNSSLSMGIFTEKCIGVSPHTENGAIAFNELNEQNISPHPADEWTMCCSPNNARFIINPNLPINIFWAMAQEERRMVVTYNVLLHDAFLTENMRIKLEEAQEVDALQSILLELASYLPNEFIFSQIDNWMTFSRNN